MKRYDVRTYILGGGANTTNFLRLDRALKFANEHLSTFERDAPEEEELRRIGNLSKEHHVTIRNQYNSPVCSARIQLDPLYRKHLRLTGKWSRLKDWPEALKPPY